MGRASLLAVCSRVGVVATAMMLGLSGCSASPTKPPHSHPPERSIRQISVQSVDMLSASTGWAITQKNQILYTSADWHTWRVVTPKGMPTVGVAEVSFASTDSNHAWMAVSPPSRPTIVYRTSNSGRSWQSVATDSAAWPQIRFLNDSSGLLLLAQTGVAGVQGVMLLRTTDGGAHWHVATDGRWSPQHTPPVFGGGKTGFGFADLQNVWITGTWMVHSFVLYATHDGGVQWQEQTLSLPPGLAGAESQPPMFFGTSSGVLPVAQLNNQSTVFYQTTDGGRTWTPTTPVRGNVYAIIDAHNIVATDGITIYRTEDGGVQWTQVQPDLSLQGVSDLDFISPMDGWAVVNGHLLRTTDGGATWAKAG